MAEATLESTLQVSIEKLQEEKATLQKENAAHKTVIDEKDKEIAVLKEALKKATDKNKAAETKIVALTKAAASQPASKKESFEYEGSRYELLVGKYNIPGLGLRTALEIVADADAQKYLVEGQSELIRKKA